MAAALEAVELETFADLLHRLGDIPAARVRLRPAPGTATAKDVLAIHAKAGLLCELVDGTLVEKAMGFKACCLGAALLSYLLDFVNSRNLGLVVGEAGMLRLSTGLLRIPDVSYISWSRIPEPHQ